MLLLQMSLCLLSRMMTCVCVWVYTSDRNERWRANTKVKGRKECRCKGKKQKGSTRNVVVGKRKGATKSYLLPGERINLSLGRDSNHITVLLAYRSFLFLAAPHLSFSTFFSSKKEPSIGFSQAILHAAALRNLYEEGWLKGTIKLVRFMAFFAQTNGQWFNFLYIIIVIIAQLTPPQPYFSVLYTTSPCLLFQGA